MWEATESIRERWKRRSRTRRQRQGTLIWNRKVTQYMQNHFPTTQWANMLILQELTNRQKHYPLLQIFQSWRIPSVNQLLMASVLHVMVLSTLRKQHKFSPINFLGKQVWKGLKHCICRNILTQWEECFQGTLTADVSPTIQVGLRRAKPAAIRWKTSHVD